MAIAIDQDQEKPVISLFFYYQYNPIWWGVILAKISIDVKRKMSNKCWNCFYVLVSLWFYCIFCCFLVIVYVNKSILIVITHLYYVNAIYYFNNTIEVAMLLLGLNSFITNVIDLVTKKHAILLAWQQELKNQNH